MKRKLKRDLTGKVFGRLTVLERDYSKTNRVYWWCKCSCENKTIKSIWSASLLNGETKSCGCIWEEALRKPHNIKTNSYDLSGEYGIGYTSKGKEFYFDLEDYDLIKDYCWNVNKEGYIVTTVYNTPNEKKERIRMHRLIMNATEDDEVDHIFHNNNDNRKNKLRLVNNSKNQMNASTRIDNTSGRKGVYWHVRNECWQVYIQANKKRMYLGSFNNFEDAVKVREEAEEKYFGEYSYDNSVKLDTLSSSIKQLKDITID